MTKFSEKVRAEAFWRDRALCCYSGKSLWLADYDAYDSQCDHLVPRSQNGSNDLSNAITCNWITNNERRDRAAPPILFRAGVITAAGIEKFGGSTPAHVADHLRRMSRLAISDAYLNASFRWLNLAVHWLMRPDRFGYDRGDTYSAKACLTKLNMWRKLAEKAHDAPPAERGLAPLVNDEWHRVFWRLQHCTTVSEVSEIARTLVAIETERGNDYETTAPEGLVVLLTELGRSLGFNSTQLQQLSQLFEHHRDDLDAIADVVPYARDEDEESPAVDMRIWVDETVTADAVLQVVHAYAKLAGNSTARAGRIVKAVMARHEAIIENIAGGMARIEGADSSRALQRPEARRARRTP